MPWEAWKQIVSSRDFGRRYRRWTENGQTRVIQWDSEYGDFTDAFNKQITRSEAERLMTPATNVGLADSLFPRSQESSSRVNLPSQAGYGRTPGNPDTYNGRLGDAQFSSPGQRYSVRNDDFRSGRTYESRDIGRSTVPQLTPQRAVPQPSVPQLTIPQRNFNASSDLRQLDNLRGGERDEVDRYLPTSARALDQKANSTTQAISRSGMSRRDLQQRQVPSMSGRDPPQDLGEFETDDVEKFAIKMKNAETVGDLKNDNLGNPYFRLSTKSLDPNYKRRPGQWFVPGKIFAVLWHENAGQGSESVNKTPGDRDRSSSWEPIYSHIRRLVVIKNRRGYCLCVSINTYGGQGCLKRGLTREEANAHAVIYDSHKGRPPSVGDERLLTKDPIAVDMVYGETFNKWSRIHFGKIYSIESNLKVREIGKVTKESLPVLLRYAKEEWAVITD